MCVVVRLDAPVRVIQVANSLLIKLDGTARGWTAHKHKSDNDRSQHDDRRYPCEYPRHPTCLRHIMSPLPEVVSEYEQRNSDCPRQLGDKLQRNITGEISLQ